MLDFVTADEEPTYAAEQPGYAAGDAGYAYEQQFGEPEAGAEQAEAYEEPTATQTGYAAEETEEIVE